jgi:hypothetical protein
MAERDPLLSKANVALVGAAIVLGAGATSAFGAYQAVNGDEGALRDFVANVAWPGVLIFGAVVAVVWFGWKANLD